ncbi:hypothetical protein MKX01_017699 [Papaver californicum]|nr:hypothetical protein MKX01_017699 [Papaver californicum]
MGNLNSESKYENLRLARISENRARLAYLGLDTGITELRTVVSSSTTSPNKRKWCKKVYDYSSLRRSNRLIPQSESVPRRPTRLNGRGGISKQKEWKLFDAEERELEEKNRISSDALTRRCDSKSRGSIYNLFWGFVATFAGKRNYVEKKIASIVETLILISHVLGRQVVWPAILALVCFVEPVSRLDMVKNLKMPYWICNSSLCLKKRKMVPTGIAIYEAREMGYASVAHLLMDKLQKKGLTN